MTHSTQLEALKKDLDFFLSSPFYNADLAPVDDEVKKFVNTMKNYAQVHTEAFITLCEAGNIVGAHHFVRLLTDCLYRTFCITLFEGKKLKKNIAKFFKGKDPKDTKYKGKPLHPQYIKELTKEKGWNIETWQDIGNASCHPTYYYQLKNSNFTEKDIDEVAGFMRYPLSFLAAEIYTLLQKK